MSKKVPVEKGKAYEIVINTLGTSGEGVGRYDEFTVFVPYALPGETVETVIDEVKKTYAKGHVKKIIEQSADRVEPICGIYDKCGGCQLQGKSYEKQLSLKQARMENLLGRIHKVNPILGMEDPYHYRNKVNVTFGFEDNRVLCGNYLSNTHQIVEVDSCMINDVLSDKIIQSIKEFVIRHKVNIFDENSLKGCIRHVLIRSINKKEYIDRKSVV